ncbi:hypothetical protein KAFR_0C05840 [Kazachstania africana CBS 2517]|uniref:Uncharacterized protein n=1 Tax=Kazachstania africana (strain ATCC 22294 / BCRC 22015 / CBS 2517 / CECT 1963 / NBRC 1671 / NRRL Y-8276) TaxID=1071382 RepID=H2AT75_KAZAF|nr:hypothetical protein KAFR_0C05840 [Kazachstania africana CBS 2517]CCF57575.1 hypothetical protein KAFR_0C05840 [Kazachstania africana CBS 2517]
MDDSWGDLRNTYRRVRLRASVQKSYDYFINGVSFDTAPQCIVNPTYEEPEFEGVKIVRTSKLHDVCIEECSTHNLSQRQRQKKIKIYFTEDGKCVRKDYPSRPCVVNNAIIRNKSHKLWLELWMLFKDQINYRLNNKERFFKFPNFLFRDGLHDEMLQHIPDSKMRKRKILNLKTPIQKKPRTILCHINGRRHTWVSLDWMIKIFAKDVDHIIVITNIPKLISSDKEQQHGYNKFYGYDKDEIMDKMDNIFQYISTLLDSVPKPKITKVTIETMVGKTKKILIDAINNYHPDLLVFSTLKWERNSNLITWKNSKTLVNKVTSKFSIPVFVVPTRRMIRFHLELQKQCVDNNRHDDVFSFDSYSTDMASSLEKWQLFKKNANDDSSSDGPESIVSSSPPRSSSLTFSSGICRVEASQTTRKRMAMKQALREVESVTGKSLNDITLDKVDVILRFTTKLYSVPMVEAEPPINGKLLHRPKLINSQGNVSDDDSKTISGNFSEDSRNLPNKITFDTHVQQENGLLRYKNLIPLRETKSTSGLTKRKSFESTRSTFSSSSHSKASNNKALGSFLTFFKGNNSHRNRTKNTDDSSSHSSPQKEKTNQMAKLFFKSSKK